MNQTRTVKRTNNNVIKSAFIINCQLAPTRTYILMAPRVVYFPQPTSNNADQRKTRTGLSKSRDYEGLVDAG